MLMLRLQRVGRKNDPSFRVVVTDSKNGPKSGKFLEVIGFYDVKKGKAEVDGERVKYWLSVGAKASGTLHNILIDKKIIDGKKINVLPKRKPVEKKEEPKAEAPQATEPEKVAEAPAPEESAPVAEEPAPISSEEAKVDSSL